MSVTRPDLLTPKTFAAAGAACLAIAAGLALSGSFAYLAAASVGMFLIAAALLTRTVRSRTSRAAAVILLAGVALTIFGLTATPFFYLGWVLMVASAVMALVGGAATRRS